MPSCIYRCFAVTFLGTQSHLGDQRAEVLQSCGCIKYRPKAATTQKRTREGLLLHTIKETFGWPRFGAPRQSCFHTRSKRVVAERLPIFSWWRPPLACTKGSLLLQMFVAEKHEVRKSKPRAKRHFDRMEREPEPDTHVTNAASLMLNINFFVHLVRTQSNRPPKYILMVTSPFSF